MRLGFSSVTCPEWDLDTIIAQAKALGYASVELSGLQGQAHLPASPALGDAAAVAERFRDAGVALVCLATQNALHWPDRAQLAEEMQRVRENIELAGRLGCRFVRVLPGTVPAGEQKQATLMRIAKALRELGPTAARHRVTLLLENHGDFTGSRDLWFVLDGANHPYVQCCWNPCLGRLGGDAAGLAVPRLNRHIALVHVMDVEFNAPGKAMPSERCEIVNNDMAALSVSLATQLRIPGQGQMDYERILDLLRGIGYDGDLIFCWPERMMRGLATAADALPAAQAALKGMLEKLAAVKELSAYKGDKNMPKYALPRGSAAS